MSTRRRGSRSAGFSLIEVMVAMTLGLLLLAGLSSIFVYGSRSYRQDDRISRMHDELRYAMAQIAQDAEMAGFFGPFVRVENITGTPALAQDCGPSGVSWAYRVQSLEDAISVGNSPADGAAANALHQCIAASEFVPGTDILAIKRVHGRVEMTDTTWDDGQSGWNGRVYFRTNGLQGLLFAYTSGANPDTSAVATPNQNWRYRPKIYFIRNHATTVGDGTPALCTKVLDLYSGTPRMQTASAGCLAAGVENMQVELGIDTTGDAIPDYFDADPTPLERSSATTLRVFLLVRSTEPDYSYQNQKEYVLGTTVIPADNRPFYRKVISTHVVLRNPRDRLGVGYE